MLSDSLLHDTVACIASRKRVQVALQAKVMKIENKSLLLDEDPLDFDIFHLTVFALAYLLLFS